jgi:uncharacterized protein (TIGR03083 family)
MTKQAVVALNAERELALELITSLEPEEWDAPSDCFGWRVRDVVAHMGGLFHSVGEPSAVARAPGTDDAERQADAAVDQRREWAIEDVAAEYVEWSEKAIELVKGFQEPPLAETVIALGNLGSHPMQLIANAFVFDHYCHLRWDILRPHGPIDRPPLPKDDLRLHAALEWMLGGLPQMSAVGLTQVDRTINFVFEGPGSGEWVMAPGSPFVTITPGHDGAGAATVTTTADDFVCWATTRRPWRSMGVRLDGDEPYAAEILDTFNVI